MPKGIFERKERYRRTQAEIAADKEKKAEVIDLRALYRPTKKQIEAHTCPERYVLYGGAVGGGKSAWLANEVIQLSLDYPGNIGYLCRHELASFRRTTLLELEKFLPEKLILNHHMTESYFQLKNGSLIYYGGLGDDNKAIDRLKSMTLGWWAIDQAEETSENFFFLLASRLRLVLPGIIYKGLMTANPQPGWVKHRFIETLPEDHVFIPALPRDNPYLPKDYEKRLRKLYPRDLVRQLLEGDWDVLEAGKFLFKYADIKNAVNRKFYIETDIENRFENEVLKMGVDIAAGGEDESVATIRRGNNVEWFETWREANTMATTGKIITLMERWSIKPENVNLDSIGVGKGVYDRLVEQKFNVNGIIAGEVAQDKEHYANIKAEGYYQLAKMFEEGLISIPDDQDLISQLSTIRYDTQSDKKFLIVSKDIMKHKYNVRSPDRADSLMLAFLSAKKGSPNIRWL